MSYHAEARLCSDCGAATGGTVMVGTTLGDFFCGSCWRATLAAAALPSPPSPKLDAHLEQMEREATAADESRDEPAVAIPDAEPAQ